MYISFLSLLAALAFCQPHAMASDVNADENVFDLTAKKKPKSMTEEAEDHQVFRIRKPAGFREQFGVEGFKTFERPPSDNFTRWWVTSRKALGLPWRSTHICRHTYATMALFATRDITSVQASLGHEKRDMTEKYAKAVALLSSGTAEKIAAIFNLGGVEKNNVLEDFRESGMK